MNNYMNEIMNMPAGEQELAISRLQKAAPDLLVACIHLKSALEQSHQIIHQEIGARFSAQLISNVQIWALAEEAIAKARGE